MDLPLNGKRVIVTGGTKGIGQSIVRDLHARGATVLFCGRDGEAGARLAGELGDRGLFEQADVSRVPDCERVVRAAVERMGGLEGLVNNAGIFPRAPLIEESEEQFDRIFAVDIKGPFFLCREALKVMDPDAGGSIVNMGSTHGYDGMYPLASYACAKGALLTLTRHIARNYAHRKIRANWITVGWVVTEGELALRESQGRTMEWLEQQGREIIPLGRLQRGQDMADAVAFLLSDASAQVTGAELPVTGGLLLPYGPQADID